jgi:septal ring factor EnvC (AmiA/AmiB activator)
MFKLTFALLLVVSGCWAQCTSDSCDTDSTDTQLRVIMQQLEELRLENNKLKTTLEMTNQEFRSTIEGLETTIGGLETTIGAQETTNLQFRTTIGGLETANAELRKNISLIQTTSTELQTANEQLQMTVANLQMNVTQLRATSTASAAAYFSVAANTTETYNYDEAIKFPVTHTNVVPAGSTGGWDAANNQFTCPVTGDYMFVVTLWKAENEYNEFTARLTRTSLYGTDTRITRMLNHKSSSVNGAIFFSSTMQAIVPCAKGEKVWVWVNCGGGCRLYDETAAHYNTFTGFKL